MTILKVHSEGATRLEALHALLSELEVLKIEYIEYGNVFIEYVPQFSLTGGERAPLYRATWR